MPELPEVETIVRGLRKRVIGRRILKVIVKNPRAVRPQKPTAFARPISGKVILTVSRNGKWICFRLSDDGYLWAHLGMTGRFRWNEPDSHARVIFQLDGQATLVFSDIRTFGRLALGPSDALEPPGVTLGVDPIHDEVSPKYLRDHFQRRTAAVKDLLLNQEIVSGIGNIYATEILFEARIHPLRPANSLTLKECRLLVKCIRSCLERAIRYGGTTISDFLTLDGEPGGFEEHIKIYGRQGQPCPNCGALLERYVLHQRSGVFCPRCQRRHPALACPPKAECGIQENSPLLLQEKKRGGRNR